MITRRLLSGQVQPYRGARNMLYDIEAIEHRLDVMIHHLDANLNHLDAKHN
jgi:hypothetical protein